MTPTVHGSMSLELLRAPDGVGLVIRIRSIVLGREIIIPLSGDCSEAIQRLINEEGDKRIFSPDRMNGQ